MNINRKPFILYWLVIINVVAWSTLLLVYTAEASDGVEWTEIIVHHTATPPGVEFDTQTCKEVHQQRLGTDGSYCGYHYLIHRDGTVENSTPLDHRGAHQRGKNHSAIGIAFVMDGTVESPTDYALEAFCAVRGQLESALEYTLPTSCHFDYKATICPSKELCEAVRQ